jgi:hypothetical protein
MPGGWRLAALAVCAVSALVPVAGAASPLAAEAGAPLAPAPARLPPAASTPAAGATPDSRSPLQALISAVDAWEPSPQEVPPQQVPPQPQEEQPRLRTWEMPAVQVVGEAPPALREEELIGPYRQPRWTAHRRFATVRTYVIPEGEIDVEYWARIDEPQHGETRVRNLYEIEFGLPHRFQLDLYLRAQNEGDWEPLDMSGQMIEGRYAFADWGKLWGNPAAYLEWINNYSEPDAWEAKLLLADQLAPSWHWSTNLSLEQQTTGSNEREMQITYGLSKTLVDEVFSVGGEVKAQRVTAEGDHGDHNDEFFVGPSFQWRPSHRTHIDFAPLVGVGGESPNAQIFFIFGYEF